MNKFLNFSQTRVTCSKKKKKRVADLDITETGTREGEKER